ncbi:MAG: DUF4364 domain-containing protein [Xylanivirga thermophila]|jgi:predicted transcriptional regulator|uniref:DUF4364 family protein n=1 Tax=Xylanivirga thermophila TaxID=2496273 RepID=UPI00101D883B|nr:DUF4364 family protein [Xylanivirga thermophila]
MGQITEIADNKLSILYFMHCLGIPLTNPQITQFFLENNLLDYFLLQQSLGELVSSELVNYLEAGNRYFYCITAKGNEVLEFFKHRLSVSTRELIESYAQKNRNKLRKESQITADYIKISNKQYEVVCRVMEQEVTLLELKLNVVNSHQARTICNNWKNKAPEIYKSIMEGLTT